MKLPWKPERRAPVLRTQGKVPRTTDAVHLVLSRGDVQSQETILSLRERIQQQR